MPACDHSDLDWLACRRFPRLLVVLSRRCYPTSHCTVTPPCGHDCKPCERFPCCTRCAHMDARYGKEWGHKLQMVSLYPGTPSRVTSVSRRWRSFDLSFNSARPYATRRHTTGRRGLVWGNVLNAAVVYFVRLACSAATITATSLQSATPARPRTFFSRVPLPLADTGFGPA